jgi:hypothetical protein
MVYEYGLVKTCQVLEKTKKAPDCLVWRFQIAKVFVYNSGNPKNQTLWLATAGTADKLSRKAVHDGANGNK